MRRILRAVVLLQVQNTCQIPIGQNHPPPPFKFLPTLSSLSSILNTRTQQIPLPFLPFSAIKHPRKLLKFESFPYFPIRVGFLFPLTGFYKKFGKTGLPVWMLGLSVDRLRADMNRLLALLFHQGVLDEQFLQLQQLQDESSPNFVSEVVNIYFHESEKLLRNLRALLVDKEFSDYKKMGVHLNQFMGSSSSIGAKRVRNVCVAFRAASEQNNRAGCLRALELLEYEYCYLKNKLHELFQIEQQRILAAAVRYPVQHHHHQPNNP
ncbi:histidine-containing phosphotransfer protein 6 [Sesamum alatum]|uniref:Histidine-containing phosphotransfer protein n=1 Tax=Sesamum alatum TaxID=300844 RepID=A0AAE1YD33_9LAMI|nr:histidine-containing phosphotransfer protein 6 [Sesamum alatum]